MFLGLVINKCVVSLLNSEFVSVRNTSWVQSDFSTRLRTSRFHRLLHGVAIDYAQGWMDHRIELAMDLGLDPCAGYLFTVMTYNLHLSKTI